MDVSKAWFALISASGTTNNVSKRKHDFYRHSVIFITKTSLNFTMAKLLKLAVNYSWYHMAHAEPVYYR